MRMNIDYYRELEEELRDMSPNERREFQENARRTHLLEAFSKLTYEMAFIPLYGNGVPHIRNSDLLKWQELRDECKEVGIKAWNSFDFYVQQATLRLNQIPLIH